MTIEAIIMMSAAWTIIFFFTLKFFIKILKTPRRKE